MNTTTVERIESDIGQLSLAEQLWPMERLDRRIRERTLRTQTVLESELAAMESDPDIQRELQQIEAELAGTEADGLGAE